MSRKIEFAPNSNIESAVYELLAAKSRGEDVYGYFNGHKLYSNSVTMDSAYQEVFGCAKAEYDQKEKEWRENYKKEEEARKQRETIYKQMVAQSKNPGEKVVISMPAIINGLKFIAENKDIDQIDLVQGLIDLGCNFTLDDINQQFPTEVLLFEGMKKCEPSCGASVIVNVRDSEYGRAFSNDRFLSNDDKTSIYHFVREVTGDPNYTKENIEAMTKKSGHTK